MRVFFVIAVLIGAGVLGAFFLWPSEDIAAVEQTPPPPPEPQEELTEYEVNEGDTFTTVMNGLGIGYAEALDILEVSQDIYDFTSINLGKEMRRFDLEGELVRLEYDIDRERMIHVFPEGESWRAEEVAIQYEVETVSTSGTIESSLWVAGLNAGMSEAAIIEMAEVFAWSVDFATQTQKDDSFKVVYEKRYRDGEFVGVGDVITAEYVNVGTPFRAHMFTDSEGTTAYYDENGESLQRQFLKAPIKYNRISSGFSFARFHPVTGRTTPHRAIDYAAPTGTPIRAVGDGKVTFAGWSGGYGKFVKIRHNDIYATHYAHMSRIAVNAGQRVSQGEVIGYVGSTGFSTGPHLHYEIAKYGTLVNPLKVELPPGDPIREEDREAFNQARDEQAAKLDELPN